MSRDIVLKMVHIRHFAYERGHRSIFRKFVDQILVATAHHEFPVSLYFYLIFGFDQTPVVARYFAHILKEFKHMCR